MFTDKIKIHVIEKENWQFDDYYVFKLSWIWDPDFYLIAEKIFAVKCYYCWSDIYFAQNNKWNFCPLTLDISESVLVWQCCRYSHYLYCNK